MVDNPGLLPLELSYAISLQYQISQTLPLQLICNQGSHSVVNTSNQLSQCSTEISFHSVDWQTVGLNNQIFDAVNLKKIQWSQDIVTTIFH